MCKSRTYIYLFRWHHLDFTKSVCVCCNLSQCAWLAGKKYDPHFTALKWAQKCYNHQISVVEKRLQFKSKISGGVTDSILYSKAMCRKPKRQQLTAEMYSCVSAQNFLQSMWGAIMKLDYIFKSIFNMKCKTLSSGTNRFTLVCLNCFHRDWVQVLICFNSRLIRCINADGDPHW